MTLRFPCRPGIALAVSILFSYTTATAHAAPERPEVLSRIAFGSCAKQDRPQPIWEAVLAAKPELFLMVGDNIYGDTNDMEVLREKYGLLAAQPGFARLREACPVLATWDDHDYGQNDAGVEYPKKAESQRILLDFFGEPRDSPRRTREGVYGAEVFGPPGKRVQVILLDTRYFRSPLVRREPREPGFGPYTANADPKATVLGEAQWAWLAEELRRPAELRVIASSIQLIADEHGWETWGNFPRERARLFDLLRETKADGVVFVSGDRHQGELSVLRPAAGAAGGAPYPVYDLTSSGLTQTRPPNAPFEANAHRIGEAYRLANFGVISVDWTKPDPSVELQIRDVAGAVKVTETMRLSDLRAQ